MKHFYTVRRTLYVCSFFLLLYAAFFSVQCLLHANVSASLSSPLFIGVVVKDYDSTIPFFLKTLEQLDLDTQNVYLEMDVCTASQKVHDTIYTWIDQHTTQFKDISCIDSRHLFHDEQTQIEKNRCYGKIQNNLLIKCRQLQCSTCCLLSSDVFLRPKTISYLLQKKAPIIAPLLRAIPESADPFRNFFSDVTPYGYFKESSTYYDIAYRINKGTFLVPCVSYMYLISSEYLDQLSFTDNFIDWEFLSFSASARRKNIAQYICNEKEFGFFFHFKNDISLQQKRKFTLAAIDVGPPPYIADTLCRTYCENDLELKRHIQHECSHRTTTPYIVQKTDTYYVNDGDDQTKEYIAEKSHMWEHYLAPICKKYIRPSSTVINMIDHMGVDSLAFSQLVDTGGIVHVFESDVDNAAKIAVNMYINKRSNVVIYRDSPIRHDLPIRHVNITAKKKRKRLFFRYKKDRSTTSRRFFSFLPSSYENMEKAAVAKALFYPYKKPISKEKKSSFPPLDSLSFNSTVSCIKIGPIRFCKLRQIMYGAKVVIRQNRPIILLEIEEMAEKNLHIACIEKMGYCASYVEKNTFFFIPHYIFCLQKNEWKEEEKPTTLDESSYQARSSPIHVAWQGPFVHYDSLSHVNRSITRELIQIPDIKIACVVPEQDRYNSAYSSLSQCIDEKELLSNSDVTMSHITVRHAWPPLWQRPQHGKWVLIQPWEFGALPQEWVHNAHMVDEIWVPTYFVRNEFIESGVPAEKVAVVPNGFDPKIYNLHVAPCRLPTKKKFKFLFVGGTIYRKGIDILLSSYQKAFSNKDDVCLVIKDFGCQGIYRSQTHEKSISAQQHDPDAAEIVYLDDEMSYQDLAKLYAACDCLVSPYRGEGFALPVLEAMACGLPVVVTAHGATDDFVTNMTGWFIPSSKVSIGSFLDTIQLVKDGWLLQPDADMLAALMKWLVRHPQAVKKKGAAAAKHALKNWTWHKAAEKAAARMRVVAEKPTKT